MRCTLIAALALALLPSALLAQEQPKRLKKTTITADPRIGFQAGLANTGGKEYLFKAGAWAPVSVDIMVGDDPLENAELSVEVADIDDVQNTYTVKLPRSVKPQQSITVNTYVRVGSRGGEMMTRVTQGGSEVTRRPSQFDTLDLDDLLFVAIGGQLPGFRQALNAQRPRDNNNPGNPNFNNFNRQSNEGHVARLETVDSLPRNWFGYQAADLVLLTTSDADFVNKLINDKARHGALMEWVLRGGKLVISGGRNHDLLPALAPEVLEAGGEQKLARLKVKPGGLKLPRLNLDAYVRGQVPVPLEALPAKEGEPATLSLANFQRKRGKDIEVLAYSSDEKDKHPVVVRVPYGTGQIVLTAFDIDQPPFSQWASQNDFWKRLQEDMGVSLSSAENLPMRGFNFEPNTSNDVAASLLGLLQAFPEVSNISFGWVALFIFVYIIVVGPLDYFFLKKVVKRLELTWITFPTVVLVVSVVAYFTAYALKGNDLLINKADVVDIDLEGQTGYGHTWFTLFSPRIQNYTVGLEPATPVWAKPAGDDDKAVLLGWMGKPDESFGGMGRSRSQSLFRRTYNYAPDATGLEGVPIQVWSMKSFNGSWVRPVNPDTPPLVADLKFGGDDGRHPVGTITNQLPFELSDAHLIVGGGRGGMVYSFDKPLVTDTPQRLLSNRQGRTLADWLTSGVPQQGFGQNRPAPSDKTSIFRRISFFQSDPGARQTRNVTMRNLDLSWRLRLKNEAILVARVAHKSGPAEQITADPISSSRLWLGKLPAANETRPPLLGTINQDTYIRVFIPVKGGKEEE